MDRRTLSLTLNGGADSPSSPMAESQQTNRELGPALVPMPLALPMAKLQIKPVGSQGVLFGADFPITGAFPSSLLSHVSTVCLSLSLPSFLWNVPGGEEMGKRCVLWKG